MLVLLGVVLAITGAFVAMLGLLGALSAGMRLRPGPGATNTRIGDLRAGTDPAPGPRVVVRGRVGAGPGGIYAAPLSGRDCVWYLASQSAVHEDERDTVERFSAEPFALVDERGARALVGPRCPALEQIPPSSRDIRTDAHPFFDHPAAAGTRVEVHEFTLDAGQELFAAGSLRAGPDGTPHIGGEVTLSAAPEAAAGDPARAELRRNLRRGGIGVALIVIGALVLGAAPQSGSSSGDCPPDAVCARPAPG